MWNLQLKKIIFVKAVTEKRKIHKLTNPEIVLTVIHEIRLN